MNSHLQRDASNVLDNLGASLERFSGKTILITGACGFLGSHFLHVFALANRSGRLSSPCKVIATDNFIRGVPTWLAELEGEIEVEKADIIKQTEFPAADFVIHAASIASPIYYRKHPIETMDANVIGLRNLLDFSLKHQFESILFFSSSEIYGDPDPANIPTSEDYRGFVSCTGPRACYDESKRYGETLCVNFHRVHGTPVKIARPFNNYGPGLKITDRRAIPDFARDIIAGNDIALLSDGLATRTFCYASDAITGYLLVLLSEHNGEAFNIGTETPEINMRDLAALVIKAAGADLKVTYQVSDDKEYLSDNPQRRCPSIEKAKKLLNYQPRITLEEGLERTMAFYKDNPEGADA